MLTIEDCIALSELTKGEVDAIAKHEHIPEIIAAEMGAYLVRLAGGQQAILAMIRDDIAAARARDDDMQAAKLKLVLTAFMRHFPLSQPTS